MSEATAGPWVVVVGMHRSGTSALTGAIGALGFNLVDAEDRLSTHESNPEHWESLSILMFNDRILADFGGTWDAPPLLPQDWEIGESLPDKAAASEALATAYPDRGPSVLKDPRLCLLLPYWRQVLNAPMAAVLVWRAPLAVARSLHRRDGLPIPLGLALWERYNRAAVANLSQDEVFVLDYDAMIEHPEASFSELASWLSSVRAFEDVPTRDRGAALSTITANLRHESGHNPDDDGGALLLEPQRQLVLELSDLAGSHRGLPSLPSSESAWTDAMLDTRRSSNVLELKQLQRQIEHCEAERDWYATALEGARSRLARIETSSSWRLTAPLRSLAARLGTSHGDPSERGTTSRVADGPL